MLQEMRQASKSWVAWVLMGFLIISFAIWGINDIFRTSPTETLASVGDTEIGIGVFDQEFRRELDRLNRQFNAQVTPDQARALGMDRQVLERLMTNTAIENKADELGVAVSDETVAAQIRDVPGFKGPSGEFSRLVFEQALRANNFTEAGFVETLRRELVRDQLMSSVLTGVRPPAGLADALFAWRAERRTLDYVTITPEFAGEIPEPDEAAIQAYLDANRPRFTQPETRAVTLVSIGSSDVAGEVEISDAEVQELYEANRRFFDTPEQRDVQQIRFDSREAAVAARERIVAGADFLAVAQEQGLSADAVNLGLVSKENLPPAIAEAAFALPANAVSEPIEGPFGWVLVRTTAITPGTTKPVDEAKAEIREQLVRERAADKIYALSVRFEDLRAEGRSLEEAAQELNVSIQKLPSLRRDGTSADGATPLLPQEPRLLGDIFEAETGQDSELAETRDGVFYAFRVDSVSPETLPPLEQLRPELVAQWKSEQRAIRLRQFAENQAIAANQGKTFEQIAQELGRAPVRSQPLLRNTQDATFSQELVARIFSTPPGAFVAAPAGSGESFVLARVAEVLPPPADSPEVAQAKASFAQELGQQFTEDVARQFVAALQTRYGTRVDEQLLARLGNPEAQP